MYEKEFKGQRDSKITKKEVKMTRFEDYLVYITVGAITGKFIEYVIKTTLGKSFVHWYTVLIFGGICGILLLKRQRLRNYVRSIF